MPEKKRQIERDTMVLRITTITALITALLVAGGMYGWHLRVVDEESRQAATDDFTELQATVSDLQTRLANVTDEDTFTTSTYQAVLETLPVSLRCAYINVEGFSDTAYRLQRPFFATDDATLADFEAAFAATAMPSDLSITYLCTDGIAYGFTGSLPNESFVAGAWMPGNSEAVTSEANEAYRPAGLVRNNAGEMLFILQSDTNETATLNAATGEWEVITW